MENFPLTIMIFNFIIFVVMIMRKKLLIVATIMILFGLLIFAGPYYVPDETEENPKASDPMDHAYDMAKVTERFVAEERGGYTDDKSVAVLVGITLIAGGVIFLMKSNDEDFLPGI